MTGVCNVAEVLVEQPYNGLQEDEKDVYMYCVSSLMTILCVLTYGVCSEDSDTV